MSAFWDGLLGDKPTIAELTKAAAALIALGKPPGADNLDPASWVSDSFALSAVDVYVAPISDDNDRSITISPRPDAAYQSKATAVARSQVALAGFRLAGLLNQNLK